MSSQRDSSTPGIQVVRETMVAVEDNSGRHHQAHSRTPSSTTTIRSGEVESQLRQESRPKRFRMSSGSNLLSDFFRPDNSEDTPRRRTRDAGSERDMLKDLIDFLRNTSPPPETSSPADQKRNKSRKRRVFWPFWRKPKTRTSPPAPGLIKLPDSAVAGRTIGGHRHIAISIPIEYAHLEPLSHRPVPPPPVEPSWIIPMSVLKHVEENRESLESQARGKTPRLVPASGDLFSLFSEPGCSPVRKAETGAEQGGPEPTARSRNAHTSVGARNTTIVATELTAPHEGSVSSFSPITSELPSQLRRIHSQGSLRAAPTDREASPDGPGRQSMDPNILRKRPSPADSFYSSGSEPVLADAVTIQIPSPKLAARLSGYLQSVGAETGPVTRLSDSDSGSSDSRSSVASIDEAEQDDTRSPRFTFSALDHRVLPPIWESTESSTSGSTPSCSPDCQQPGVVFSVTSLESLVPKGEGSRTFRITPIMTVADVRPCSPDPPSLRRRATVDLLPSAEKTHRRIPTASIVPPPKQDRPQRQSRPHPSITDFKTLKRLLEGPESDERVAEPTTTVNGHRPLDENGDERSTSPPKPQARPIPRTESHQELIRRYDDLRQTRERELGILIERLERLENNNDRWLSAIVPVFERILETTPSGSRLSWRSGSHQLGERHRSASPFAKNGKQQLQEGELGEAEARMLTCLGLSEREESGESSEDSFDWDRVKPRGYGRPRGSAEEERGEGSGWKDNRNGKNADFEASQCIMRRNSMGWGTLEPLMRELVEGAGGSNAASLERKMLAL